MIENEVLEYLQKKSICLIGFMGSGKSYVGNYLAKILKLRLIDTDKMIEEKENMSISEIFKEYGETYFRSLEKKILQDIVFTLPENEKIILCAGGGMPLKKANQRLIKMLDPLIICLNPSFEVILSRIKGTNRPLIYRRSRKYIFNLWIDRYAIYQKTAHITISDKTIEDLLDTLNKRVKIYIHSHKL